MIGRWRAWRLERARLELEDLLDHRDRWGWAYRPSEDDARRRRHERLERRIGRLSAKARTASTL